MQIWSIVLNEYHLCNFNQVETSEQTFFNFLILWESIFLPKKIYNIYRWTPESHFAIFSNVIACE